MPWSLRLGGKDHISFAIPWFWLFSYLSVRLSRSLGTYQPKWRKLHIFYVFTTNSMESLSCIVDTCCIFKCNYVQCILYFLEKCKPPRGTFSSEFETDQVVKSYILLQPSVIQIRGTCSFMRGSRNRNEVHCIQYSEYEGKFNSIGTSKILQGLGLEAPFQY